jgi:hypothetical protein
VKRAGRGAWTWGSQRRAATVGMAVIGSMLVLAGCASDGSGQAREASGASATTTTSPKPSPPETSSPSGSPTSGTEDPPSAGTASPSAPPSDLPASGTAPHDLLLTIKDSERIVQLGVGGSVSVRLDGPWAWRGPLVDGNAVTVTEVNFFADPGYSEWTVVGARPGHAIVKIIGEASCPTDRDVVCVLGPKVVFFTFIVR